MLRLTNDEIIKLQLYIYYFSPITSNQVESGGIHILLVRMWTKRHFQALFIQVQNSKICIEGNLTVSIKHINTFTIWCSTVQFRHSVVSDSLWPHESQHTRLPCPSPTPRVHSDWRPGKSKKLSGRLYLHRYKIVYIPSYSLQHYWFIKIFWHYKLCNTHTLEYYEDTERIRMLCINKERSPVYLKRKWQVYNRVHMLPFVWEKIKCVFPCLCIKLYQDKEEIYKNVFF